MLTDVDATLSLLKETLLRRLGDEVELIFRFGSSVTDQTHAYSDIDISYVPVHEATWDSITVTVGDTLIDLFPLHWSRLERWANFDDPRCTVLFDAQILYQRTDDSAARFTALGTRLSELLQPEAYPTMLRKAQVIFQNLGYSSFLLRQQAERGHRLACMQQAQDLLKGVLHCLAVLNQSAIDTRKRAQVLALPKLPVGFATTVDRVMAATEPPDILQACDTLMQTTHALLLAEQQALRCGPSGFREVFGPGYPELKGDIQHLMLACERRDRFNFNLMSLYHELMVHTAQALTGVVYSDFNSIADYEQDLGALGFPDLLSSLVRGDFDMLHCQCQAFDIRLQQYLTEHDVPLYSFATLDELREHLAVDFMGL